MAPLCCRLGQQAQVGRDELPFFLADIAGRGACVHPPILRARTRWFITRSEQPYPPSLPLNPSTLYWTKQSLALRHRIVTFPSRLGRERNEVVMNPLLLNRCISITDHVCLLHLDILGGSRTAE